MSKDYQVKGNSWQGSGEVDTVEYGNSGGTHYDWSSDDPGGVMTGVASGQTYAPITPASPDTPWIEDIPDWDWNVMDIRYEYGLPVEHNFAKGVVFSYFDGGGMDRQELSADTEWVLHSGGKSGSKVKHLLAVNSPFHPQQYGRPPQMLWGDTPATDVDAKSVKILGGNFGDDYTRWTVQPDGATVDLNYSATPNHVAEWLSVQKYKLHIVVNGTTPLTDDHIVSGAYYCVGQKLTFEAVFSPSLPDGTYTTPTWNYTADYINYHFTDSAGCERCYIATEPAMSNPTTAWFYNKQTKDAQVNLGIYCQFANGQTAYLIRKGKFNVFTPTIQFYPEDGSNVVVEVRHDAVNGNANETYLGLGDDNHVDAMSFSAMITSNPKFPGQAIATQLINRQEFLYALFGNISLGTGGTNDLDKSEIYQDSQTSLTNNPDHPNYNPQGQVSLFDAPGIGLSYASPTPYLVASLTAWASCNDRFNTYFRFKPNGDADNIYVTLGLVNWDWHGSAIYIGGFPSDPYPLSNWQVSGTGHDGPGFQQVNDFPLWPAVY